MHSATSRRRLRKRKVPRLPRRKSPLRQVYQNLQTLMYLLLHCLLLASRRAASVRHHQATPCRRPPRSLASRSVRAGAALVFEVEKLK